MSYRQAILLAVFLGLALGVIAGVVAELYEEREFVKSACRPAEDDVPAADISALHEEARKIIRDADDS